MEMQKNESQEQEFTLDIFNVSQESDEIQIVLDETYEASVVESGRRC